MTDRDILDRLHPRCPTCRCQWNGHWDRTAPGASVVQAVLAATEQKRQP